MEVQNDELSFPRRVVAPALHSFRLVPIPIRRFCLHPVHFRYLLDLPYNQFCVNWRKLHKPALDVLRRGLDVGGVRRRGEADGEEHPDGRAHEGDDECPLERPVASGAQRGY